MSRKRTIDAFFGVPPPKKPRTRNGGEEAEETHVSLSLMTISLNPP